MKVGLPTLIITALTLLPLTALGEQATATPTSTFTVDPRCSGDRARTSCTNDRRVRDYIAGLTTPTPSPSKHPRAEIEQRELERKQALSEIRKKIGPTIEGHGGHVSK